MTCQWVALVTAVSFLSYLSLSPLLRELQCLHLLSDVVISTFRSTPLNRMLAVYHELGIPCQLGDCNGEHIYRHISHQMAQELEFAVPLISIVGRVKELSGIISTNFVSTQTPKN